MKYLLLLLLLVSPARAVETPKSGAADSLAYQKADRALRQKPADWQQALTYFLETQKEYRTDPEVIRLIGICLQNTGRPLAAMAWHQAYRALPGADAQKAEFARRQVELLEVDVRAKMGGLFSQALLVAEKQVKERVAVQGVRYQTSANLHLLPRLQAEAGMLPEALAAEKRISALNIGRDNYSVDATELRPSLRGTFALALADYGDVPGVQRILATATPEERDDGKPINGFSFLEEVSSMSELIHLNLSRSGDFRVRAAEELAGEDPLENVDAKTGALMRSPEADGIPVALARLGRDIGRTLLRVRAMDPANISDKLTNDAAQYASRRLGEIYKWGPGTFSIGTLAPREKYYRQIVRALSYADVNTTALRDERGRSWPGIAHALGAAGSPKLAALLTECGMGVNDPIFAYGPVPDNTPLHWAVIWDNLDAVDILLAHGADPNRRNSQGETPRSLAQKAGKEAILALFSAGNAGR